MQEFSPVFGLTSVLFGELNKQLLYMVGNYEGNKTSEVFFLSPSQEKSNLTWGEKKKTSLYLWD